MTQYVTEAFLSQVILLAEDGILQHQTPLWDYTLIIHYTIVPMDR